MPRGHKRDATETAARNFQCEDSFVGMDGHDYLNGEDWFTRKCEVYARDRGTCQMCKMPTYMTLQPFDVDHIKPRGKGGHDDMDNLRLLCRPCHNERHPEKRVQWTGGKYVEQRKD